MQVAFFIRCRFFIHRCHDCIDKFHACHCVACVNRAKIHVLAGVLIKKSCQCQIAWFFIRVFKVGSKRNVSAVSVRRIFIVFLHALCFGFNGRFFFCIVDFCGSFCCGFRCFGKRLIGLFPIRFILLQFSACFNVLIFRRGKRLTVISADITFCTFSDLIHKVHLIRLVIYGFVCITRIAKVFRCTFRCRVAQRCLYDIFAWALPKDQFQFSAVRVPVVKDGLLIFQHIVSDKSVAAKEIYNAVVFSRQQRAGIYILPKGVNGSVNPDRLFAYSGYLAVFGINRLDAEQGIRIYIAIRPCLGIRQDIMSHQTVHLVQERKVRFFRHCGASPVHIIIPVSNLFFCIPAVKIADPCRLGNLNVRKDFRPD